MVRLILTDTGQELTLKPGQQIPLELNSPIQADGSTPGSKSYTFNLPIVPVNQLALGFPELLQSTASRQRSWPVLLIDSGLAIMHGLLKIRGIGKEYTTNVTGSVGAFSETLRGRKMTELDELGSLELATESKTVNLYYVKVPTAHDVVDYQIVSGGVGTIFRFKDLTGGHTKSIPYSGTLEQTLIDLAGAINIDDDYPMTADAKGQTFQIVPDAGTRNCSLYIQTDWHDDVAGIFRFEEWEETLVQLTYDSVEPAPINATTSRTGTNPAHAFVFPQIYNPAFYPADNAVYSGYVNAYQAGSYGFNSEHEVSKYTLTPMFFLFWVIRKLCELQGYTAEGDLFDDTELAQLVIYNTHSLDEQSNELETPYNGYKTVIRYADHMPDLAVGDFLNTVTGQFGVQMFFNEREKKIRFMFMSTVLNAPAAINLDGRTSPQYSSTQDDPKVLKLAFTLSEQDATQKGGGGIFASYLPDGSEATETLEFAGSSLEMVTQAGRLLPHAEQPGISPLFSLSENTSPLRLLFWKGLQTDANGASYPAAGNELNGKKLQWSGAGGLYETYWPAWYQFKTDAIAIDKEVDFDAVQLAQLDFEKKQYFSGLTWLPVKVSASLPVQKRAKVTFYRC